MTPIHLLFGRVRSRRTTIVAFHVGSIFAIVPIDLNGFRHSIGIKIAVARPVLRTTSGLRSGRFSASRTRTLALRET